MKPKWQARGFGDMGACDALGLLKMDFLGLRNLTGIDDALRNIELNGKPPLDLENLELDDATSCWSMPG